MDESKQHIVFIDGYTLKGDKHIDVQKACYSWLKKDREKRRLVVVCSMSSRYKAKIWCRILNSLTSILGRKRSIFLLFKMTNSSPLQQRDRSRSMPTISSGKIKRISIFWSETAIGTKTVIFFFTSAAVNYVLWRAVPVHCCGHWLWLDKVSSKIGQEFEE